MKLVEVYREDTPKGKGRPNEAAQSSFRPGARRREAQALGQPLRTVAPDGLGVHRVPGGVGGESLRGGRGQVKFDEIFARGEAVLLAVLEEEGGLRLADGADGVERRELSAEAFQLVARGDAA